MRFLEMLNDRLREPSTYAGAAGVAYGLKELNILGEGAAVGDAIAQAAPALVQGDYVTGGLALVFGLIAAFTGEKGRRR